MPSTSAPPPSRRSRGTWPGSTSLRSRSSPWSCACASRPRRPPDASLAERDEALVREAGGDGIDRDAAIDVHGEDLVIAGSGQTVRDAERVGAGVGDAQ